MLLVPEKQQLMLVQCLLDSVRLLWAEIGAINISDVCTKVAVIECPQIQSSHSAFKLAIFIRQKRRDA